MCRHVYLQTQKGLLSLVLGGTKQNKNEVLVQKKWFYKCVTKVPSVFTSSFSLFLFFFSRERFSMKRKRE